MKKIFLSLALLLISCKPGTDVHAVDRLNNAEDAAQYTVELQACYDAAITEYINGANPLDVQSHYSSCQFAADIKHHRKSK